MYSPPGVPASVLQRSSFSSLVSTARSSRSGSKLDRLPLIVRVAVRLVRHQRSEPPLSQLGFEVLADRRVLVGVLDLIPRHALRLVAVLEQRRDYVEGEVSRRRWPDVEV